MRGFKVTADGAFNMVARMMFYSPFGKFGFLANFSNHCITVDGRRWRTVEHYYQAQKFKRNKTIYNQIRSARSPAGAKRIAMTYKTARSTKWMQQREEVMYAAVHSKFSQHPGLRQKLLATANLLLIERSLRDPYWGIGVRGNGANRMGVVLMRVRDEIAKQLADCARSLPHDL